MRVRVEIKAKHIKGAEHRASRCPLARALQDLLGAEVLVGTEDWNRWLHDESFVLSGSARRIVKRWDDNVQIRPCAIFMDIPEEVLLRAHHG